MTDKEIDYYRKGINKIYNIYLEAIDNKDNNNVIFQLFINTQNKKYLENTSNKRIVLDFIAGMTDDFLIKEINKYIDKIK